MKAVWMLAAAAGVASMAMAQATAPVRAEPAQGETVAPQAPADPAVAGEPLSAEQLELRQLREEVMRLREQVTTQQQSPQRREDAPQAITPAPQMPERTASTNQQRLRPVQQHAGNAPVRPLAGGHVAVSRVRVNDRRSGNELRVVADVTLNNVPGVPFIMEAVLVTPDEAVHTDARGNAYSASREVRTGDQRDTDDYGVTLDIGNLFSSRPPDDLYVQVRLLSMEGHIVAKSGLYSFRRPWR